MQAALCGVPSWGSGRRSSVVRFLGIVLALALTFVAGCGPRIPPPDDVAAPLPDATVLPSGLAYKVLTEGTGSKPTRTDRVLVHYTGWTTDGKSFDSSVSRGEPLEFPLRGVIPGWTEGLTYMQEGAKHRLWVPEKLAYRGASGKPKGMLVFDVELLEIK